MMDTAFYVPNEKLDRFVAFYTHDKDRKWVTTSQDDYANAAQVAFGRRRPGFDGLGLLRFCQMLLNGGYSTASASSLR